MKLFVWVVSLFSAMMLTTETYAQDEPNAVRGSHFYRSYCVVCHGTDGKGKGPLAEKMNLVPADLSAGEYQTRNVEDLAATIGDYVKTEASKMPSWGEVLTKPDLDDIAAYIPKLEQTSLRFRGDTRRGRAIFKSACVACHGQFGTGKGVLAELIGIPMVDYTRSETLEKISDEELMNIIRDGKGDYMPSWKGALDDDEIADVASYVRRLSTMAVTVGTSAQHKPNPLAGKHLYRTYCLVCHGGNGKGKGPLQKG